MVNKFYCKLLNDFYIEFFVYYEKFLWKSVRDIKKTIFLENGANSYNPFHLTYMNNIENIHLYYKQYIRNYHRFVCTFLVVIYCKHVSLAFRKLTLVTNDITAKQNWNVFIKYIFATNGIPHYKKPFLRCRYHNIQFLYLTFRSRPNLRNRINVVTRTSQIA